MATKAQVFAPRIAISPGFRPRWLIDHQKAAASAVQIKLQTALRRNKTAQRRPPVVAELSTQAVATSSDDWQTIMRGMNRGSRNSTHESGRPQINQREPQTTIAPPSISRLTVSSLRGAD